MNIPVNLKYSESHESVANKKYAKFLLGLDTGDIDEFKEGRYINFSDLSCEEINEEHKEFIGDKGIEKIVYEALNNLNVNLPDNKSGENMARRKKRKPHF